MTPKEKTAEREGAREIEAREAAYWDQHAVLTDPEGMLGPADDNRSVQRRLELLGDVSGRRVLDVGCGTGEWSVILAKRGAAVCAIDISPRSIAATAKRAAFHGVADRVHAEAMSAMSTTFADGSFDLVHGQDIIHHLDAAAFGREIARVLRPGGRAVFSENSANNRILMFARDTLCGRWGIPKWSSDDEYPLTKARLSEFARPFAHIAIEYPEFFFFHYFDAKFFGYKNRIVRSTCRGLDQFVFRFLKPLRRYSYRQLICCDR